METLTTTLRRWRQGKYRNMKDILEFKGKNVSLFYDLNLLCNERNIYVMDNHNAALWCWLQEIDTDQKYNVLHVDAHYDTRSGNIDKWLEYIPSNLQDLDISDFLSLKFDSPNFENGYEIMHWDNYFPIFHRLYRNNINRYHFFTHKAGSMFDEMKPILDEYPIPGLFNLMDYLFDEENSGTDNWIVNIDLDYFFQHIENTDITLRIISYEAIDFFLQKIKPYLNEKITVMTIALSPECCGGWENSLALMDYFAKKLEIEFSINEPSL